MKSRIVVATITLARSEPEEELLLSSLSALVGCGFPAVVADGGSARRFVKVVRGLPGVTVLEHVPHDGPRLLTQVRRAFGAAVEAGAEWVLYTEPDKAGFFAEQLARFAACVGQAPEGGLTLAARDEASFATFPAGQQLTESLFNRLCEATFDQVGDYLYGPLLLHRDMVPPLFSLQEDVGWGWRPYVMAIAHRSGRRIVHFEANLPCPLGQRGEDDVAARVYRMEQLSQNVRGLALGLKTPL